MTEKESMIHHFDFENKWELYYCAKQQAIIIEGKK